jgi:hypothetical protein
MKKLIILGFCCVFTMYLTAQETDSLPSSDNKSTYKSNENEGANITTKETTKKGKPDTTNLKVGETEISIIEEDGETSIKIKDKKESEELQSRNENENDAVDAPASPEAPEFGDSKEKDKKFKGHWAGFEFGPNNYVDKNFSLTRSAESEFLDLNTGKSWNFNLNFAQYSFPVASNKFGLVTGLGVEWSNYHFENNNSIQKIDGEIQSVPIPMNTEKNRLQTTYLTIPLLTEIQVFKGNRGDRLYFSAGVIGGIKLFSNTKIKYYDGGNKQKKKSKSDFYLSPLRYAVTARVGYKMVKLYANYYLTSLFLEDRGPELYPVAVGLAIAF